MGIVNDSLPGWAFIEPRDQPNREARFALSYGRHLNVTEELLDRHLAGGFADRPAIRFEGRALTYGMLSERVNRLANALVHVGIKPGCRILIHLPNTPEFVESWLASLRIGAVVVATMPMLKYRELLQIVEETEPACLITTPQLGCVLDECAPPTVMRVLVGGDKPAQLAYETLIMGANRVCKPAATAEDDVAIIAYTSGSAGRQKGTVHTHSDILAIADTYAGGILSPTREDCFACHAPMAFTYGLGALLVFPLRFGASTVIDAGVFDPARWLDIVRRECVTRLFTTPTAARFYLEQPACRDRAIWRHVRTVVSAGEVLSKETFDRWRETTDTDILDGCGSTEMLHIWISQRHGEAVGGCTGRVVPHYQVRMLDDAGQVIHSDEAEGIVAIQGPTGCRYWRQPELQSSVVKGGWTSTGDVFRRDASGRYWFVSRTDDIIVTGGYQVSPVEVQEVLLRCPAIRDAAVVGVPDGTRGQIVSACVILNPGSKPGDALVCEIQAYAKTQIAAFKCPRQIVFLKEFPRTSTGKLDRSCLRGAAADTKP